MNLINRFFNKLVNDNMLNWVPDKIYLSILYKLRYNKKLNLDNPVTYNEKLQWLKLYDRNPIYTTMVDKYKVKKYVADLIGEEYVIPVIGVWDSFDKIDFDKLPNQFVLKTSQGSGDIVICKNKSTFDYDRAKTLINKSMANNYYKYSREWPYKNVEKKVFVEEYINLGYKNDHYDYKFICCDGVVKALFLDVGVVDFSTGGHSEEYYRNIYNKNFELMPYLETRANTPFLVRKPKNYDKMVEIAETLSKGIPQVRVDLYNINGKIYFGEMTFYHGGGFSNFFMPEGTDKVFGDWIDLSKAYCYKEKGQIK